MLGSRKMPRRSFVLRRRRSLKGISRCAKSVILGSLLGGGEIFFRGNLFLHATRLRRFCAERPVGYYARAAFDVVANFDEQLGISGEPEVGAGAKTHEANAFAARDAIAGFFPADYAAGDESGDLLESDFAGLGGEVDHVLFVVGGGHGAHGGGKLAGAILHVGDDAGGGGAVDMHVPDGKEDGHALAGPAGVLFVGDDKYAAVRWGDDGARVGGNYAFGVAEEVKDKGGEAEKDNACDRPAQK